MGVKMGRGAEATVRRVGSVSIVDLRGKLLMGEGLQELQSGLSDLLESNETHLVINLRDTEKVDSAGIGTLVAVKLKALRKGGDVALLAPSRRVRQLLTTVRMDLVFHIVDSEVAAIASFRKPVKIPPIRSDLKRDEMSTDS